MKRKTGFVVALTVVILGIAAWFLFQRLNKVPYELATVRRGDIVEEVSATGSVDPLMRTDLQFKNSGEIVFLKAAVGQKVAAGEVVAGQDASLLRSQLKQLQAELATQEYKLKARQENTIANYDDTYDIKAQEAIVAQARADVETQKIRISETILRSPIDGFVVAVNVEVGEFVKLETVVISIISDDAVRIKADVSETTIANVKIGQKVKITLDAFDGTAEWTGTVLDIDPAETAKGGAVYYGTTIVFDEKDDRVKPGMTANVLIETAVSKNTLFVPASALRPKNTKRIVEVLDKKQVVEKEVKTGLKNGSGLVEILSGVSEGEQVILGNKK